MSGRRSDAFIGLAVEEKWTEVFALLDRSEAGVDDYEVNDSTILHWAALHGAVAQLDKLVQRGANVEAKTGYGRTPLHYAAANNHTEAAKRLVFLGADLSAKDRDGETPIDRARLRGHPKLAAWLKTARAQRHWAEARALGRGTTGAFACASFWHTHVGKQLCAPGAKWAERDRAAFEQDFN